MKRFIAVVALGLAATSAFASEVVIKCPLDPERVALGVQLDTIGRCQGEIGLLAAKEGRTVRMLLPSPICFPIGARGVRLRVGPGLDDRAPEGVLAVVNGAVAGEIDFYVRNNTTVAMPELWLGMEWSCRQPRPATTGDSSSR